MKTTKEKIEHRIVGLKRDYVMLAESLAKDFREAAQGTYFNEFVCSQKALQDLPKIAIQIQLLEAVIREGLYEGVPNEKA